MTYKFNSFEKSLPNLFLIGAPKSGTTSLAWMLSQHPEILLTTPKEPNFFHKGKFHLGMEHYSEKYLRGFNGERYRLDASQGYMIAKYVPERIISTGVDNPHFIFILREPLQRAYSDWFAWTKFMRNGVMADTFNGEIERNLKFVDKNRFNYEHEIDGRSDSNGYMYDPYIIERGMYYTYIKQYIDLFGRDRVHVLLFEDMVFTPVQLCLSIFDSLKLPEWDVVPKFKNSSRTKSSCSVIKHFLEGDSLNVLSIFNEEISNLSGLLEFDFVEHWYGGNDGSQR